MKFEELYTICLGVKLNKKTNMELREFFNSIDKKIRYIPVKEKISLLSIIDMIPIECNSEYEKIVFNTIKEDFYIYMTYLNLEEIDMFLKTNKLSDIYDVVAECGLLDLIYEYAKDDIERFKYLKNSKNMGTLNILLSEFIDAVNSLTPQEDIIETYNKLLQDPALLSTMESISLANNPEFIELQKSISKESANIKKQYAEKTILKASKKVPEADVFSEEELEKQAIERLLNHSN